MNSEQRDVAQFHLKHGFPTDTPLEDMLDVDSTMFLRQASSVLRKYSELMLAEAIRAEQHHDDTRLWNAHLLIEEVGELCYALSQRDEVKVADAIGDVLYVALGVCVRYGLPAKAIFDEVHRSNMTKEYRAENNGRLRNKGDQYSAPDMKKVLNDAR